MKNILFLCGVLLLLVSCSSTSRVTKSYGKNASNKNVNRSLKTKSSKEVSAKVSNILSDAKSYLGTPYKFGGMSSSGFDCSGFIVKVFEENDMRITRRSADQAREGREISIRHVKEGDLLFFATSKGRRVSHVGIVYDTAGGEIRFIHASTSRGVIISSLNENYWNKAFLFARRVI